jgi:type IV pilus assembly protein PilV
MMARTPKLHLARRRESGMTLIEIMIAILLVSFGLMGFVALQARAVQFSIGAEDSNRAALLANEIAATMQLYQTVNPPAALYAAWQARVGNAAVTGLPGGTGTVTAGAAGNTATVTITWTPVNAASGAQAHQYVTYVVLP